MTQVSTRSWLAGVAVVALPLLILVWTGLEGIDFGPHWDEHRQLSSVERTVQTGILLPGFYAYPSVSYWLTLGALAPDFAGCVWRSLDEETCGNSLLSTIHSHGYLLRVRAVFLIVSALAVVWTHLLVLVWRRSLLEALLASSLLASSWQVAYHLRWIAPDGPLMQFGGLTALLVALALLRPVERPWLSLAAVASGAAAGSKYPGAMLFLPVALCAWSIGRDRADRARQIALRVLVLAAIFIAAYLVTTPGTLLEPFRFEARLVFEARHYQGGHRGYTVSPGPAHLMQLLRFFGGSLFSANPPVAWLFAALSVVGGVRLLQQSPRQTAVLFSFPLAYVLYMSAQQVLIIRNHLVVAPFLAVLAAVGAMELIRKLADARIRALAVTAAFLIVALDAGWLFEAAATIRARNTVRQVVELTHWLDEHSHSRIVVSPRVAAVLDAMGRRPPSGTGTAELAVLFVSEGPPLLSWPANDPELTVTSFGPYEVDFNYYPTWRANDRIIVMRREKAKALGLDWVK